MSLRCALARCSDGPAGVGAAEAEPGGRQIQKWRHCRAGRRAGGAPCWIDTREARGGFVDSTRLLPRARFSLCSLDLLD